ncbi:nuclear transport factor 2 family protein [Gordonia terrae]
MTLRVQPHAGETADAATLLDIVEKYFLYSDAGKSETLDLFDDDVEIYFPVFGIRRGKAAFGEFVEGFLAKIGSIAHNLEDFTCTVAGDTVVVEGTTRGTALDGQSWSGGQTPGGRFCSVFNIKNSLITRMYIYTDPDYTSDNSAGFGWDSSPDGGW